MMREPRRPVAAPRSRPGFPRLAAAWAILAASPIAFADATVPTSNAGPLRASAEGDAPAPVKEEKTSPPQPQHPRLGGHVAMVHPIEKGSPQSRKIHVCDGKSCKIEPKSRTP